MISQTAPGHAVTASSLSLQSSAHTWFEKARAGFGAHWDAYWQRKHDRATRLLLRSLSDRTLNDIGLHRSEIESLVSSKGSGRRLTYRPVWE